jgi:hypothetical protein
VERLLQWVRLWRLLARIRVQVTVNCQVGRREGQVSDETIRTRRTRSSLCRFGKRSHSR